MNCALLTEVRTCAHPIFAYFADHAKEVKNFHFMPVGLWSEDATFRFYAPRDPTHVSHSIVNLQETESYFEARCRSIASLMAELGHDRLDLLKVDVEGAEHEVIRSMLASGIRPTVLCMELDQPEIGRASCRERVCQYV